MQLQQEQDNNQTGCTAVVVASWSVGGAQVVNIDFPWKDAAEPWKVPKANSNYHRNLMDKGWRTSLKPLNIDQPEGPSFTVRLQAPLLDPVLP